MLSIVMNARNVKTHVANCLGSLLDSVAALRIESGIEYVFADDASDAGNEIIPYFLEMRRRTKAPVKIFRFKKRQHYTAGLAYTFSAAAGESILYVSHDMVVTPDYIRTLLAVAALDPSIGVVRGTSPFVDCFPEHQIPKTLPARNISDIFRFSVYVAEQNGLAWTEDQFLTGDSMLIKSAALEKVGVFDHRYFGYFGDIDFGLRVQRAGLKLVCAKGAWLMHEGAAYYKEQAGNQTLTKQHPVHNARMKVVQEAYRLFCQKWDPTLPSNFPTTDQIDFARLRSISRPQEEDYQPRLALDDAIVEQL